MSPDQNQHRKRIISGIKPTGDVHLGSYLGAMKQWVGYQQAGSEAFFFIADLHALNSRLQPEILRCNVLDLVAWLIALGIDPDISPIFLQSQVSAHAEMGWLLNNFTTMGELSRMTQYKDKAAKSGPEGELVALFDYPVLMAADILLYDADEVPVGHDQAQHVELTRNIAERINNLYGPVFKLPEFILPSTGARIMMLDDPTKKMSKSQAGDGCIYLSDSPDIIQRKISRATTDSVGVINYDRQNQPGISNLLEILSSIQLVSIDQLANDWRSGSYSELKQAVANQIIQELALVKSKFNQARQDESHLKRLLAAGKYKAGVIAHKKYHEIGRLVGLL